MEARGEPRIGVALATRDRRELVLSTVARLRALPERPPIVVADDGSVDGTAAALRARGDAGVEVIALRSSVGAAARTEAVARLRTPYVAFSDDDSWWEPGALARAAALLDRHPRVGLIAAAVLVGPERRLDPTCVAMASGPLAAAAGRNSGPGVPVTGFVACGAVVRRSAFVAVGGFHRRFEVGGEEQLLALDLAAAGWEVRHVPEIVARHCPPGGGAPRPARVAATLRNDLWTIWLRRPPRRLPGATARRLWAAGPWRRTTAAGAIAALRGLRWVARERRVVPAAVERDLRAVERG
ncbi:glycosyltransferase family 2 protein [Conexibacter arvalis]|uniref:GT2 family glycosyltransferase n=1 Tax=Conexibacter arvalis TaxID=912552 RepID=A0A840IDY6_9ACTN|nr:glycosyltransferase [Conexibacter arvalis]MBB4662284.1 GT2 family glycosyltransferase [Conexibacter arvalis]